MPRHKKKTTHLSIRIAGTFLASLLLLVFMAVFYFLVLISVEYKSFPFISKIIEEKVNQILPAGGKLKVNKSLVKFDKLSKILVKFDDVKLTIDNKQDISLSKIEAEFPIFNLILGRIVPTEIKIINPEITIDHTASSPKIVLSGIGKKQIFLTQDLQQLSQAILSLQKANIIIKNFLILDGIITLKNTEGEHKIFLKKSQITASFSNKYLLLDSQNIISLNPLDPDLLINPNCQFKQSGSLKCIINFDNLLPAAISSMHSKLLPLKDISANFNGNFDLTINNQYKLSDFSFTMKSSKGNFYYPQFFSQKINFQNLNLNGQLDNINKVFTINKLSSNFDKTNFTMSLTTNNFVDKEKKHTLIKIQINNAPINELNTLWPISLNQKNIRKWVIEHIKDGVIRDGYAIMEFRHKNNTENLTKIKSELIFSNLNLQYSKEFPKISNASGIAAFSIKGMTIDIARADVLQSKINSAYISIPDFRVPDVMLNIDGKIFGAAADPLKHINYKSEFSQQITNYLKGQANTAINIKLPLAKKKLELKDFYIKIHSDIKNFNNDYIDKDSSALITTIKKFGDNDFISEIDLTNSNINLKEFNITKKQGVTSKINSIIAFNNNNQIQLRDFNIQQQDSNVNGNLAIQINPLKITNVTLNNYNFVGSNVKLEYFDSKNSRFLSLQGETLNLKPFLEFSSNGNIQDLGLHKKNNIKINIDKLYLANNQKFTNVNVDIDCQFSKCQKGFIQAQLQDNKYVSIAILPPKLAYLNDNSKIKGKIDDISLIAKGFDISTKIIGGTAIIEAKITDDGYVDGDLNIKSGFTIIKNKVAEQISNNKIFSNVTKESLIKDTIQFDDLSLKFVLKNDSIDIDKLIVSSNFMGFTAKGNVNFNKNETILKGLIVPGYTINKLFNVGKIPIIGKILVGEEGGGVFAMRYDYIKNNKQNEFRINPASAIIPGGIRNIFDLF